MNYNSLSSLDAVGPKFTWDNRRKIPHLIQERLDQFVANPKWLSNFPDYQVVNLDFFDSDHRLVLINTRATISKGESFKRNSFTVNHN